MHVRRRIKASRTERGEGGINPIATPTLQGFRTAHSAYFGIRLHSPHGFACSLNFEERYEFDILADGCFSVFKQSNIDRLYSVLLVYLVRRSLPPLRISFSTVPRTQTRCFDIVVRILQ